MITDLTPEQRTELEEAFHSAFRLGDMERMLKLGLGIDIYRRAPMYGDNETIFSRVVDVAITDGWLEQLLVAAHKYKPGNFRLSEIVGKLGAVEVPKPAIHSPKTIPVDATSPSNTLEKVVRQRAPLLLFNDFVKRLHGIELQICRIEYPDGVAMGTGWLVGPDLLLTAYHVIQEIYESSTGYSPSDVICRFDFNKPPQEQALSEGKIYKLAADWLIDCSPFALSDEDGSSNDPQDDQLDYALLKLNERAGEEKVDQNTSRGWIQIASPDRNTVEVKDQILIPQHPQGRPLELSFGEVLAYNGNKTRLRYDATTDHGSSGAPCMNILLVPIGLHHAGGPTKAHRYNQCVPLRKIIDLMKTRGVTPFWSAN